VRRRDEEQRQRDEIQMQQYDAMRHGMTSTLRPSLNSKLYFKLVDLTISFSIDHLTILSKLIHCIATCIANGVAAGNSGAVIPTFPTTTSFQATSWSFSTFTIISLFIPLFLCYSLVDAGLPYTLFW
jgi:hypothetical protein